MLKIISLMSKRSDRTREEFDHHWEHVHAPMTNEIPEVKKYVLNFVVDGHGRPDVADFNLESPIDGIAELWFENEEALQKALTHDIAKTALSDGPNFLGRQHNYIVREKSIK